jgi:hypothetical protein
VTTDVVHVRDAIDELFETRTPVDWDDAAGPLELAEAIFDEVAGSPETLVSLVEAHPLDDGNAESFPALDKLVLWQSPDAEVRLRLHVFFPGYADRTHNHRWSFVSRILSGGYVHSLYGAEQDVLREVTDGGAPRVVYAGHVQAGSTYFLHHSLVHSLRTDEVAVSLILRGPSTKTDYFTVAAAETLWSTGAARESAAERAAKAMTNEGRERVLRVLEELRR